MDPAASLTNSGAIGRALSVRPGTSRDGLFEEQGIGQGVRVGDQAVLRRCDIRGRLLRASLAVATHIGQICALPGW